MQVGFYANNFEAVKTVILNLKDDTRSSVGCKNILNKAAVKEQLKYIEAQFKDLPHTIEFFETQNLPLRESFAKLKTTISHLESLSDEFGSQLKTKIQLFSAKIRTFIYYKF